MSDMTEHVQTPRGVTIRPKSATPNGVAAEDAGAGPTVATPAGLYEKLALITAQAHVEATGKTQQNKTVFSIGDVEKEIGRLCAEARIVTRWSSVALDSYEQATSNGTMRMWVSRLRVKVTDAVSGEAFEDEWADIGTNPMAAASFVRKGYYKALFHLAEEGDEGGRTDTTQRRQRASAPSPRSDAPHGAPDTQTPTRVSLIADILAMPGDARWTVLKGFGYRGDDMKRWVNQLDEDVAEKLAQAITVPA
jgi:hypothetical protein